MVIVKYRVLEKDGVFYPKYFDYDFDSWCKFYDYDKLESVKFFTLEQAYEFLREQTPTQFIHPFPEE